MDRAPAPPGLIERIPGYRIDAKLYESGNSLVYRAARESDGAAVVLKVLNGAYPSSARIARFRREYEITRALDGDGVIAAYALEETAARPLIVLEDFGGRSLAEVLDEMPAGGWPDLEQFLTLALALAEGLGRIHRHRVIHKDVNPSNIVWNAESGVLKYIDFGIATQLPKEESQSLNPRGLEGRMAYIAPEQTGRMNRALDYRADLYSLGATFYHMLVGEPPFGHERGTELVHSHIARAPAPPHERRTDLPEVLSHIALKLLHKNAEDRYQGAHGLAADLARCLEAHRSGGVELFVVGQADRSDRFHIPQKLYGRAEHGTALLDAFARVGQGAAEVVLVAGEAGIGKSALVGEVQKAIAQAGGYFCAGKSDQFKGNIPYDALAQAFRQLVRQLLAEGQTRIDAWRDNLSAALAGNGQVVAEVVPDIELLLGPQPAVPSLPPQEALNRFNAAFGRFVGALASAEHPLVVFLDDLQWADAPSLRLLEALLAAPEQRHLLVVGAYRDGEVDAHHPLTATLEQLQQAGAPVQALALEPLGGEHVAQMVADALQRPTAEVAALAELVMAKTRGNPFFLDQFLHALHGEGVIAFEQGRWQWDMDRAQGLDITDNVVEFMAARIQRLAPEVRRILQRAACLGSRFDQQTLAVICQVPVAEAADGLWPALQEGLLVQQGEAYRSAAPEAAEAAHGESAQELNPTYRFLHDRVRQAAYSLVAADAREALDLEVGRLLWAHAEEEHLFTIANHLDRVRHLIADPDEKLRLARLNLRAGQRAKASAAFDPALRYLGAGIDLLPADAWGRHYPLALDLHRQAMETAYLAARFDEMEAHIAAVRTHAENLLDQVETYEIECQAHYARQELGRTVATALGVLRLLGVEIAERPGKLQLVRALVGTRLRLSRRMEGLADLPAMDDPHKLAAMRIMKSALPAAYVSSREHVLLLVLKMVDLSLAHGNAAASPLAYATYGLILSSLSGSVAKGRRLAQLAWQLIEGQPVDELNAMGRLPVATLNAWSLKPGETGDFLRETYRTSIETGSFESASNAAFIYSFYSLFGGRELGAVEPELEQYSRATASFGQETDWGQQQLCRQVVANLAGEAEAPWLLAGPTYDEAEMLPVHLKGGNSLALTYLYICKMFLGYLFEEYDYALQAAADIEQRADNMIARVYLAGGAGYCYHSLSLLAECGELSGQERRRRLRKVAKQQKKIAKWAVDAPGHFLHKFHLVEAERARVLGRDDDARGHYKQAMDLARASEHRHEEALACECYARFWLARGEQEIARAFMGRAHYLYSLWGADAKVRSLESRYPHLVAVAGRHETHSAESTSGASYGTSTAYSVETARIRAEDIDLVAVVEAAQAISGQIALQDLLDQVMRLVLESAGAQRGLLLREREGRWGVEAEGAVDRSETRLFDTAPLNAEGTPALPMAIVHYVARTQEPVLLDDAAQSGPFTDEPYIAERQSQSVLCTPLLHQGRLMGMLYLENGEARGVFTPDRLAVLNILAAQAAIAMTNAELFVDLERSNHKLAETGQTLARQVEEQTRDLRQRTAQLEEANEQLASANEEVQRADEAKSNFLATMSHEIRTPLNAILGFARLLKRREDVGAEARRSVETIESSGEHLLSLINQILDLSRVEAGHLDREEVDFDLRQLVGELSAIFELGCREKSLHWQVDWWVESDAPAQVHGDEGKLRQILINLLGNAIKFTARGRVGLRVTSDPVGHYRFEVTDTGPGILPDEQTQVFEPFAQGQGEGNAQGSGLGLAIAYRYIELLGGELELDSHPDKGSVFSFSLPLPAGAPAAARPRAETRPVVGLVGGAAVDALVVDDLEANRQLLAQMLQVIGVEVRQAASGREALELVAERCPDIALLDIRMPDIDGSEVARALRRDFDSARLKLVAVSASVMAHEREQYREAGFDAFVAKPLEEDPLYRTLSDLLGVELAYEEKSEPRAALPTVDGALPAALLERLREAAEFGAISTLEELIAEVADSGEGPVADRLREYLEQLDLDGLRRCLADIESA